MSIKIMNMNMHGHSMKFTNFIQILCNFVYSSFVNYFNYFKVIYVSF